MAKDCDGDVMACGCPCSTLCGKQVTVDGCAEGFCGTVVACLPGEDEDGSAMLVCVVKCDKTGKLAYHCAGCLTVCCD